MTNYIVSTKTGNDFAALDATGSSFGTVGTMSLESIRREPEKENPRFAVSAVTMSNGGFSTKFTGEPEADNPSHREDFMSLLGAASKAKPKGA